MPKRKKKKEPKLVRGKPIDPIVAKARNLRASLLRRAATHLKDTTPSIKELQRWMTLPSYTCYYSLQVLALDEITIDHKIPLNRGGDNSLDNLCFCSSHMNTVKGDMTEKEFRELLELVKTWEDGGASLFRRIKMGHF